jgi:hypothetical protein
MSVEEAGRLRPGDWIRISADGMPVPVLSVSLDGDSAVVYVRRRGIPQRHEFLPDDPVMVVDPFPKEVSDE